MTWCGMCLYFSCWCCCLSDKPFWWQHAGTGVFEWGLPTEMFQWHLYHRTFLLISCYKSRFQLTVKMKYVNWERSSETHKKCSQWHSTQILALYLWSIYHMDESKSASLCFLILKKKITVWNWWFSRHQENPETKTLRWAGEDERGQKLTWERENGRMTRVSCRAPVGSAGDVWGNGAYTRQWACWGTLLLSY